MKTNLKNIIKSIPVLVAMSVSATSYAATPNVDGEGFWLINNSGFTFDSNVSDEFNQPGQWQTPDTSKWNRYHPTGWAGNNSFTYTNNLAYTHQGNLVLEARPGGFVGDKHTTGIVSSKQNLKHGYFEVRAKAANNNIASSFWFFNRNPVNGEQYEIDVYEHFPYVGWNDHKKSKSNIHHFVWSQATGNVDQTPNYSYAATIDNNGVNTGWHTYGVMRTPAGIYFYVDGKKVRTIWKSAVNAADYPGDVDMPVILDILVYDWQAGDNEPRQERSYYQVDYFRAWR
ncbi:family 16 glycosylhydrolase [Pseudocolwellia agarivorans]|uniref:family 16 glycosylhydrolase n=1 Tax=Pseudocolwellia agarivorans TaxID=1911682 RepID=UPI0009862645|nr:family 16 glycosylhydrolase [Pseudocolwellia agarivorans]